MIKGKVWGGERNYRIKRSERGREERGIGGFKDGFYRMYWK
jgi:hypothetical protein